MLSFKALSEQKRMRAIFAAIAACGVGATFYITSPDEVKINNDNAISFQKDAVDITNDIEDERIWLWNGINRLNESDNKIKSLETELNSDRGVNELKEKISSLEARNEKLLAKMEIMESSLQDFAERAESLERAPIVSAPFASELKDDSSNRINIYSTEFEVEKSAPSKIKNIKNTIPSNSYARATILSGLDVSASDQSQQNPKPVLLRITSWANLPNDHVLKSVVDCRLHATSFGDLASERVYMAPDLLSCIKPNGDILETSVQGYVAGEDGKIGLRGEIIARDAEKLQGAFQAGVLSGFSGVASTSQGVTSVSPLGTTKSYSASDSFKSATAGGVSSGFDMLAKYKIKQAENMHPIIQIGSGREVDVVFYRSSVIGNTDTTEDSPSQRKDNAMQSFMDDIQ